ncbi:dicarboxylate/amino acid:cation symporter [Paenibacillus dendritiformis]|uniref:dicarboxylate/amino acid:cation symporter n=1 Tax=Paenibacillus dendritiformis TaxID=130049 RepID=UPI00387E160D
MRILKNYKFSLILLGCMFIGSIAGAIMGEKAQIFSPIANLFLNLLFCCVVPLIFVSLVSAIANMESTKKLGKILGIMFSLFIFTGIIAAIYMLIVCVIFDPAKGTNIVMNEAVDASSSMNFLGMFTVEDFPLLWSRQNLMALIVFSIICGLATVSAGEKAKPVVKLFEGATEVVIKIVSYVMYLAPIGLGAFFATLIGEYGSEIAGPLSRAIIIFLIASVGYYFISSMLFAYIGGGKKGVSLFWKNIIPSTLTSLGTCSSAAAIPSNFIAAKKIGVPDDIANITIPMGANLHKDGAVLIQILKIVFMCSIFNINILEPGNLITAIMVSVVASCVMGAIPGGGYVGEIFIVSAFGFPEVAIPIMVLIGTITDAPATAINATGDVGAAMVVSRVVEGKDWINDGAQEAA